MKSLFSFDGKVAVITGAAQGVGAATANVLAKQGARVAMVDYDMPALRDLHDDEARFTPLL